MNTATSSPATPPTPPPHPVTKPVAPDRGTIDAWTLVYFVREHAFVLALSVILGLSAAVAYLYIAKPVYEAHATLEVAMADRTLSDFQQQPEAAVDLSSASLLKTVEQTVGGDAVLGRVVAANHLAADPTFVPPGPALPEATVIDLLSHRVAVNLLRGTRLIGLAVRDSDPQRARRLTQSIIDEYFNQTMQDQRESSDNTRSVLVNEAKRIADKVSDSEHQLQRYREKYDAMGLADRQTIVVERIRHLHEQVSDARNSRMALESEQTQIKAALASPRVVDELLNLSAIAERAEIIELRKQLDLEQTQITPLALRYGENHPVMVQARLQVQETQRALESAVRAAASGRLHIYDAARQTESALQKELQVEEKAAVELDRDAIAYHALERDVQANTAVYQQVLARLKGTDVLQNILATDKFSSGFVKVVEKPLVSGEPIWPRWKLVLPAGLVLGGILGIGIALARRAFDNTFTSVEDAEACLGVSAVAVVPQSRQLGFRSGGRVTLPAPGAPDAEAFRSLRTTLSLYSDAQGHQAVMFTSAMPDEGKSYCAANYAAVLAQSGRRTLLIDGDLRRPVLRHGLHKTQNRAALTDCLQDPSRFELLFEPTPVPHLFVLGNSMGTPLSSEWLASEHLRTVVGKATAQFDRVVIDTAPVAVVSDALYFARLVPTVCFVVHAGRTPKRVSQRALMRLRAVTGHAFVGLVLNQIRHDGAGYHYHYYSSKPYVPGMSSLPATG
ncbi:MAG TPA: polysaccharide biosynthesis tyrosine autokinase [Candidatus Didemnitutus sp.]|nr:polysaccharide biosynthesis tyrosine autokinase [Candidatus Didemnitutus sp.]